MFGHSVNVSLFSCMLPKNEKKGHPLSTLISKGGEFQCLLSSQWNCAGSCSFPVLSPKCLSGCTTARFTLDLFSLIFVKQTESKGRAGPATVQGQRQANAPRWWGFCQLQVLICGRNSLFTRRGHRCSDGVNPHVTFVSGQGLLRLPWSSGMSFSFGQTIRFQEERPLDWNINPGDTSSGHCLVLSSHAINRPGGYFRALWANG